MRSFCIALALAALASSACSKDKSAPPTPATSEAALSAVAPGAGDTLLRWAGDEPVALIIKGDSLVAKAMDSGRSRVLRERGVNTVLIDVQLELVWIQGLTTLDVLDLRAPFGEPTPIAIGLPERRRIRIDHVVAEKLVYLAVPQLCVQGADLTLSWTGNPRVQFTAGFEDKDLHAIDRVKLVGASFLREQVMRTPGANSLARRDFGGKKGPLPKEQLHCTGTDLCGVTLPFEEGGKLLLMTDYSEGDCQHFGCRLYDPALKKFASPPAGDKWGELDQAPPGACGLYHFDRSGKRFLIGDKACTVDGACQDLGGTAVGWLAGGTDVGTDG